MTGRKKMQIIIIIMIDAYMLLLLLLLLPCVMPIIGLEIVKSCINQKAIEGPHGDDLNFSD